MKDDFYKDMEHTRREQNKDTPNRRKRRTKVDPELSRSAKYKDEDIKTKKTSKKSSVKNTPPNSTNKQVTKEKRRNLQKHSNNVTEEKDNKKKLAANVSLASLATGAKKSLLTAKDKYSKQLDDELGESKDKLKGLKATMLTGFRSENNKRKIRALLLLILVPITLLFAFMIISNFWPEEKDYTAVNNGSINTEQKETTGKREINKEFEQKKSELEKEFAARDKEKSEVTPESNNNSSTQEAVREYSDSEKESMTSEANKAIEEKKKQDKESSKSESEEITEKEKESEKAEVEEEPKVDEQPEEDVDVVNAVHVVNGKDNLYRIAIQYYGSGSEENVQRIRDANGISGNEISVGQELIIP
ncbi:LysM peptidoglycan-binding domain-containing protein [Phocicoccus pinnipedialis]|uniref:Elastin-binding protein EbpS n=1 Tax=Phocicoccus pinnipedialis TaxID=110845 RepID=A0A6V7RDF8_9BACL|nr:LysM peptidoglycan-binding domain-containing protein [Jeotgalicoccus pinnipedialis]MBP1939355.1 Mg-chelatase subunit ChlI [Jeotgalicoccus pinnipedialis]CAD2075719.1 Elastin-binding protein EbpS [Jeotgalicoccus pinnipedialis]